MSKSSEPECACLHCRTGDLILNWLKEPPTAKEPDRRVAVAVSEVLRCVANVAVVAALPGHAGDAGTTASKMFAEHLTNAVIRAEMERIMEAAGAASPPHPAAPSTTH